MSHCLCVTLSVCHTVCVSPVCMSHCLYVTLSVCHTVCMSHCLCVTLSVCHTVCVSHCLCVTLSVCHTVCMSHCLSVCHTVCMSHCLLILPLATEMGAPLESFNDIHCITGALKLFIRELPIPLITFDCFDLCLIAASESNSCSTALHLLPPSPSLPPPSLRMLYTSRDCRHH